MRGALRLERLFQETVNLLRIQSAIQTAIAGLSSNRSPIIKMILDRGTIMRSEDPERRNRAVPEDGISSVDFHD